MTRLIIFIVSGMLLLISCSDNKEKLLEKCADTAWKKYQYSQPNQKLKIKLSDPTYERYYASCEEEQKRFPTMFKEKYN